MSQVIQTQSQEVKEGQKDYLAHYYIKQKKKKKENVWPDLIPDIRKKLFLCVCKYLVSAVPTWRFVGQGIAQVYSRPWGRSRHSVVDWHAVSGREQASMSISQLFPWKPAKRDKKNIKFLCMQYFASKNRSEISTTNTSLIHADAPGLLFYIFNKQGQTWCNWGGLASF